MRYGEQKTLPKSLTEKEFIKLLSVTPKKDMIAKVCFLLAYEAGMRISEVLNCGPEHFQANSIMILKAKYNRQRVVPIPKHWRKEFLIHLPIKLKKRAIQRKFEKYRDKAGLNPLYTFHSLRHGFATRNVENGMPINQLQVLMGHTNLATTSVYLKARPVDALNSYENLF